MTNITWSVFRINNIKKYPKNCVGVKKEQRKKKKIAGGEAKRKE